MNNRFPFTTAAARRGSALLIVLALLVLLATITIAFLSRSTLERQLSNASFSMSKVDLSGQGAASSIIGDLQQEIVAGSNGNGGAIVAGTSIPKVATGYFYPNSPITMIPSVVGFTPATGLEDLLKISKNGYSFWPSASQTGAINYAATSASYYNANTAPSRAAPVSTLTASLNGRTISASRWNKPLLLAPNSSSDYTPSSANFVAPDWIYVARDGSNPTAWSSSYAYLPNIAPTTSPGTTAGTNPVTQRYAYAIYDEGSTLDMNVAGSPITSTSTVTYSANQAYKSVLAYGDLTQLPGISGLSSAQKIAFVNAIVGWRNFASAGMASSTVFPYTSSIASTPYSTNFDQNVLSNTTGFLGVGGLAPFYGPNAAGSPNQTDNAFTSRQQLLQFMLIGLGQNTSFTSNVPLSTLTSIMPYLGTFTRGLNQPSYQPPPLSSITGTTSAPYSTSSTGRPAVLPAANGGNNAAGLDDRVNPGYLSSSVMVSGAFTRNNFSTAVMGSPLVNKRFALSRLAWLTYKGPSATRTMTDPDMVALIKSNAFGNSTSATAYLLEGTAANIQKYFGLDWDSTNHRWLYDYHNGGGVPVQNSSGAIMKLGDIAALGANGHDPDFFELLKSAINVGSLGKALAPNNSVSDDTATTTGGGTKDPLFPPNFYYPFETSVDSNIIQIGANIINQYQTAGYPVRIAFNNGALGNVLHQYVSVENYPYFYGVQTGVVPAVQPVTTGGSATVPPPPQSPPTTPGVPATGVTSDGVGVIMQWPMIWNTFDPNSSIGAVYPTQFRILADQTDPSTLESGGSVTKTFICWANANPTTSSVQYNSNAGTTYVTLDSKFASYSPGNDLTGSNIAGYKLTSSTGGMSSNSAIDLTISGNHGMMFRDPTVIMTAGGGGLNQTSFTYGSSSYSAKLESLPQDGLIGSLAGASTSGIPCVVPNPTYSYSIDGVDSVTGNQQAGQRYLGFYLGAFPLVWMNKVTPTPTIVIPSNASIATYNGSAAGTEVGIYVTYRMQYKDAFNNWVTYDSKYGAPFAAGMNTSTGSASGDGAANAFSYSSDKPIVTGSTTLSPGYNGMATYEVGSAATHDDDGATDMAFNNYTTFAIDPLTHRFGLWSHFDGGLPHEWYDTGQHMFGWLEHTFQFELSGIYENASPPNYGNFESFWGDATNNVIPPFRQDVATGNWAEGPYLPPTQTSGWTLGIQYGQTVLYPGLLSQNCTQIVPVSIKSVANGNGSVQGASTDYYADPDGVVRRADGGYVPPGDIHSPYIMYPLDEPSIWGTADTTMGLPMVQVTPFSTRTEMAPFTAPSVGLFTQINNSTSQATAPMKNDYSALISPSGSPMQSVSRPYLLHRPFRSVGELGYAFRDTPWKSICFDKPESGDSALLDVFTLNENYTSNGLEAGKINLNTRQPAVLAALLANAYIDDPETSSGVSTATTAVIGSTAALSLAQGIVSRTTDTADVAAGSGPFQNISELVGKWSNRSLTDTTTTNTAGSMAIVNPVNGPAGPDWTTGPVSPGPLANASGFIEGMTAYLGFSGMATPPCGTQVNSTVWTTATTSSDPVWTNSTAALDTTKNPNLMSLYTSGAFGTYPTTAAPIHAGVPEAMAYAKRYHEAPIRALVNGTQTRVWNLMIDVIAQTGRFPSSASSLANFDVEGERRYWVHVAIDRYTGKVLDQQVEEVKE